MKTPVIELLSTETKYQADRPIFNAKHTENNIHGEENFDFNKTKCTILNSYPHCTSLSLFLSTVALLLPTLLITRTGKKSVK